MGRDLMYEIWDNQDPQLTGSRLVIMLCLADDADNNDECWLSIARIAALARITPANVTRHIKELEAAGYLIVTRTSGTHNIYVVSSTAQPQCPPAPISSDPGGVGVVGLGECGRGANPHTNPILSPGHGAAGEPPSGPSVAGEPPSAPAPSHSARQRNSDSARQRNSDSARQRNITPRARAMPPRAPAQPTPRASARPPRAPTRAEPSVNHQELSQEPPGEPSAHVPRTPDVFGGRAPAEVPRPAPASSRTARRPAAARLQALNAKLGPELRRPLADVVLQITGTAELANTDTASGQAALYAAHEAAVTLHQLGYRAAADLLRAEQGWYANDFRGKQGERPTLKQFVEWAAKAQAAPRGAKRHGDQDHASHRQPAPVSDTHDNEAALRRVLGLGPDDPIPEDDE
jgi:hypothetical protein